MKPPGKPGQIWTPDGIHNVRVMKRVNGCQECVWENCLLLCPGIQTRQGKRIDCELRGIIFKKP